MTPVNATPRFSRGLATIVPALAVIRTYRPAWLPHDVVAGLVLSAILVPVGIAYAVASGLPGITGLYATMVVLVVYAIFGPSRILVLGPDSSLAAVILGVVLPLSASNPDRAIALAGAMGLVSGIVCIAAGALRLGFVTDLLSKPIRYGYMNGIAATVLISQIPKFFGMSIETAGPWRDSLAIVSGVVSGQANWTSLIVGVATIAIIMWIRAWWHLPGILLGLIAATGATGVFSLHERFGVATLGPLPQGLPQFVLPTIGSNDLMPVLIGGCAVALVAFADTSVLSRVYAAKVGGRADTNQEMIALGAANFVAGLF